MPTGQSDLGNPSPELPSVEMPSHLKTTRDWEFGVVWVLFGQILIIFTEKNISHSSVPDHRRTHLCHAVSLPSLPRHPSVTEAGAVFIPCFQKHSGFTLRVATLAGEGVFCLEWTRGQCEGGTFLTGKPSQKEWWSPNRQVDRVPSSASW